MTARRITSRESCRALERLNETGLYPLVEAAARDQGVTVADVVGPGRTRAVVEARHRALVALRARCPHMSSGELGRLLGYADGATIRRLALAHS